MKRFSLFAFLLVVIFCTGCSAPKNRVIVLGMVHSDHRTSDVYSLDILRSVIEEINPDYVLTEIPPDRFESARVGFQADGEVTEPRVMRFPEYADVLFPLTHSMKFEIIPCAGWTRAMAEDRAAKLNRWKTMRPIETQEVDAAQDRVEKIMASEGDPNNPLYIHTEHYDQLVKEALEPYNRLFNDDLGPGGWDNINAAHYGLIHNALEQHSGENITILITFGAWHKYWILEQLRLRNDINIVDPRSYFE